MSGSPDSPALSDRDILDARARRLARRASGDDATSFGVEMLGFTVGRERYAIESRFVFAVVQLVDLVPLPGAKPPVVGLTRWRGDVLTALDLRRVVGGVPSALDDLGRVIVIGQGGPEFGVLADIIDGLTSIDPSTLHPLPSSRHLEIAGLLTGVTADAVHMLDGAILIAHQDSDAERLPATVTPSTTVSP